MTAVLVNIKLSDSNTDTDYQRLFENLSSISNSEIKGLKQRVNFYLAHFMIISNKTKSISSRTNIQFLQKVDEILEKEIDLRLTRAAI